MKSLKYFRLVLCVCLYFEAVHMYNMVKAEKKDNTNNIVYVCTFLIKVALPVYPGWLLDVKDFPCRSDSLACKLTENMFSN